MLYYQGRKTIALAAKRRRNGASTKRRRVRRENLPSLKLKGKKVIFAQRIFWENALASSKRERERLVFFCASDYSIIPIIRIREQEAREWNNNPFLCDPGRHTRIYECEGEGGGGGGGGVLHMGMTEGEDITEMASAAASEQQQQHQQQVSKWRDWKEEKRKRNSWLDYYGFLLLLFICLFVGKQHQSSSPPPSNSSRNRILPILSSSRRVSTVLSCIGVRKEKGQVNICPYLLHRC